jgi:hypothetical protein
LWWEAKRSARAAVERYAADAFPFSGGRGVLGRMAHAMERVPEDFRGMVGRRFRRQARAGSVRAAVADMLAQPQRFITESDLHAQSTEDEIDRAAADAAMVCKAQCERWGIGAAGSPYSRPERRALVAALAAGYGLPVADEWTDEGIAARLADVALLRRAFRRHVDRLYEALMREAGRVHRRGELFVTDRTLSRVRERRRRNAEVLAQCVLFDDAAGEYMTDADGVLVTVADVAAASIANPAKRRAELMTRMVGFERVAALHDHRAVFLTVTCPSAWHRVSDKGRRRAGWNGSTPREAQAYLLRVWARVRAAWGRMGVAPYGFRVAEPHHDGTPHWHFVLFMPADRMDAALEVFRAHALAEAPDEAGARDHRFTAKAIDEGQGGATAYVAKYIAKNIDGHRVEGHDEASAEDANRGNDAGNAERVLAWASRWGIRQFQQVGGPSVTVWRELRRLREPVDGQGDLFEAARAAADEGNWLAFVDAMGGPVLPRADRPIRIAKVQAPTAGKYGESRLVVQGVCTWAPVRDGIVVLWKRVVAITRERAWRIEHSTGRERVRAIDFGERSATARALGPVSITVRSGRSGMAGAPAGSDAIGPEFPPREGLPDPPRVVH